MRMLENPLLDVLGPETSDFRVHLNGSGLRSGGAGLEKAGRATGAPGGGDLRSVINVIGSKML